MLLCLCANLRHSCFYPVFQKTASKRKQRYSLSPGERARVRGQRRFLAQTLAGPPDATRSWERAAKVGVWHISSEGVVILGLLRGMQKRAMRADRSSPVPTNVIL
ncbi:hypothetical protein TH63_13435 [Rufibacter radiotolerans]|uniref:Uncharacterized protein n=1 Tax=Rufibacter radiotolerans TaxID=1379910 RepID=A0A0H4VRJ7_9BACT|nr:hypothetical protein TH63_13435 [Rufibacter radiotolerans]